MKILMINSVCGIGSTGRICTDLAIALEMQGHEVKIAYGRGVVPKQYERFAVRIGSNFDVYLNGINARLFDSDGFGFKNTTIELIEKIKKYDPDVIHLHNLHGYYINISVLFEYLSKYKKKVIWTLHDCWAFTGHCACFTFNECYKWIDEQCIGCKFKDIYPKSILFSNSNANFVKKKNLICGISDLTIVTPSQWLADLVKQSFLKDYPVKLINNGIDLNVFKPTKSNFKDKYNLNDKRIILGVAFGWGIRKGLDVFVQLAKSLPENYQIVLVGTDNYVEKQLPNNVIAIQRTNNQKELAEIYTAADVFVNPTREDNYPTVNMEAIACGTPVITFNVGGSPECINESCGCVVEKEDIIALEKEIVRVCKDRPFVEEVCIARAQYFKKDEMYKNYCMIYSGKV